MCTQHLNKAAKYYNTQAPDDIHKIRLSFVFKFDRQKIKLIHTSNYN